MGEYGPLTIMYSAELLKDTAALEALMREDNENANGNDNDNDNDNDDSNVFGMGG